MTRDQIKSAAEQCISMNDNSSTTFDVDKFFELINPHAHCSAETGGLAGALLKIAGAISQLKLAEESTSDEVTRRHLGEIISFLSSAAETSGQEG